MSRVKSALGFLVACGVTGFGSGVTVSEAGESSWYVQGKFGEARVETTVGSRFRKSFDDQANSRSLEVGRRIHRHLALEVGIHDISGIGGLGSPCSESSQGCVERLALQTLGLCAEGTSCLDVVSELNAEAGGASLALVPRWPVNDRLAVFGKLGWIDWDVEVRPLFTPGGGESFSESSLLSGAGVRYDWPEGLGVLLEYERSELEQERYSLGLGWTF